jgi:uncharacterized protein
MKVEGPFALRLDSLVEGESAHELVGVPEDLELDPAQAVLETPLTLRISVYRGGQKLEIRGTLSARVLQSCARCLAPVHATVTVPVRVFAERRESRDTRGEEEVREDDIGIVYHDGQCVDLTEEVRQVFLVELPWYNLCKPDCLGLCPRCGANRNEESCGCPAGSTDSRWAALREWNQKKS